MNIDSVSLPPTISIYKSFDLYSLPKLVIGKRIMNLYDQKRFVIKDDFNPKYISHFINNAETPGTLYPVFIHGVDLNTTPMFDRICDELLNIRVLLSQDYKENIAHILDNYALNNKNVSVSDGMIILPIENIYALADFQVKKDALHNMLIPNDEIPEYANIHNFSLYVLFESYAYTVDKQHVTRGTSKKRKYVPKI